MHYAGFLENLQVNITKPKQVLQIYFIIQDSLLAINMDAKSLFCLFDCFQIQDLLCNTTLLTGYTFAHYSL